MTRSMLNLLIGKWSWSPAPTSTRIILCYGLNCSPSGNYLSFHTLWLSKTGEEPILLFNLGLRLLRSEIVIVNRRGHRVSTIPISLGRTTNMDSVPQKAAWANGDRLIVETRVSGQIKGWRVYTSRGILTGEIALDIGLASCREWAISPDGRYLAYIASTAGTSSPDYLIVRLLDTGRIVCRLPLDFFADEVVWSASGSKRLAAVGTEFILVCDLFQQPGGREQLATHRMMRRSGGKIVLTDDQILSVYDMGISILRADNGEPVPISKAELQHLAFAPQGKRFAAVHLIGVPSRSRELVVGEFANERLLFTRRMPVRDDITGICWSADGSEVFCLTDNGQLRMWRAV